MRNRLTKKQRYWFDIAAMHADSFAKKAAEHDENNTFALEAYDEMKKSGYASMTIPEEFGGGGASFLDLCIAQHRLAQGDGPTAFAINMHLASMALMAKRWNSGDLSIGPTLKNFHDNQLISFGVGSEPGLETMYSLVGMLYSDVKAERTKGGFLVNGRKAFGTGTPAGDMLGSSALYTHPSHGETIISFSISSNSSGLRCLNDWNTMGMRGTGSHGWEFENVFVPDANVRGSRAAFQWDAGIYTVLSTNHALFGSIYLGMARAARDFAIEYSKHRTRKPFTSPTSHYPKNQFLAGEMDILLNVAWTAQYQMAKRITNITNINNQTFIDGTCVQYFCVNAAVDIVNKAMDMLGGAALSKHLPLERYYRDVRAGPIHPIGGSEALELIGKHAFGIPRDTMPRWI